MSQATETGDDHAVGSSLDDVFSVLANQRRRFALHYLHRREEETPLGDLAERVAAWENEKAVEAVTSAERKRVYTALQQLHLPTMDEMGLVRFDSRASTVAPTDRRRSVDVALDVLGTYDVAWSRYYAALSALGVLAIGGLVVGAFPFTLLGSLGWLTLLVAAFATLSAARVYARYRNRLGAGEAPPDRLR